MGSPAQGCCRGEERLAVWLLQTISHDSVCVPKIFYLSSSPSISLCLLSHHLFAPSLSMSAVVHRPCLPRRERSRG